MPSRHGLHSHAQVSDTVTEVSRPLAETIDLQCFRGRNAVSDQGDGSVTR
jgi:hypothetical protein